MTADLIPTKVIIPKRMPGVVRRSRLIDFLLDHLERKLLLVTAPAGYGKTTLLVDIAEELDWPVCWYTLDEGDRDPSTFIAHLVASVRQKFPGFGERSMSLSQSGTLAARAAAAALVNDMINEVPEYFALVLDDWHLVGDEPAIRDLLDHLLQYVPEHAHLIVAGRTLLRGPLVRLAAQGAVAGLGPDDLRFTPEEVRELLAGKYNIEVSLEQAVKLVEGSEGWITGILLTSQAMQGLLAGLIHAAGRPDALYGYLAGEVFDRLSPPMRRFLLESSVPRQFTVALCDELRGISGSDVWIEQVEARSLFLTRVVAGDETWYRYHHLFRDFLLTRFKRDDPPEFARLNARSGEWFEARSQLEEAVDHYLAAGALERAARVMDAHALNLFLSGRTQTLSLWYETLPVEYHALTPELDQFYGQTVGDRGRSAEALAALERAETAYRTRGDTSRAVRACLLQGWPYFTQGQLNKSLEIGASVLKTLEELNPADTGLKAETFRLIGASYNSLGQWRNAEEYLGQALAWYRQGAVGDRRTFDLGRVLQDLANALRAQGRLEEASAYQSESLKLWREIGNPGPLAASLNNAGYDRFLIGDYDSALGLYVEALAMAEEAEDDRARAYMLEGIAATHRERGDFERAIEIYGEVVDAAHRVGDQYLIAWALDGLGHAYRLSGNVDRALSLFEQARRLAERAGNRQQVTSSIASMGVARVEVLNVTEGVANLETAMTDLRSTQSVLDLARVLFWLSRAYFADSQYSRSTATLIEVMRLGDRLGCRPFSLAEGRHANSFLDWAISQLPGEQRLRVWRDSLRVAIGEPLPQPHPVAVAAPRIEVRAFGAGQVFRDGRLLAPTEWGGSAIARELLFYLLESSPRRKEEIGAALWPNLPPARMTNAFHAAKYRAKRALGVEFVLYDADWYHMDPEAGIWYDVVEFRRLLETARKQSIDEPGYVTTLQSAVDLYTGEYLQSVYSDWVAEPRQELQARYFDALNRLVSLLLHRQQHEQVLRLCERGIALDYFREELHRGLMQSLAEMGRRAEALSHFSVFSGRLRRELDALPTQETQSLVARIRTRR